MKNIFLGKKGQLSIPANAEPAKSYKFFKKNMKMRNFYTNPFKNMLIFSLKPLFLIFIAIAVGIYCLIKIDDFFDHYTLELASPIKVVFQTPVQVVERKAKIKYVKEFIESLPKPETPLDNYICEKFGNECQIALLVARAESNMNEEAININKNGTIDMGIFQINSVHWKKEGCNPKSLLDARKNVNCAYKIFQGSGWEAWATFKNLKVK